MASGQILFSQLTDFLPMDDFRKCVKQYRGNYKVRKFSCFDQFLSMAFAQLTGRESLRDIETCLDAMESKLYHAGFRSKVRRSTLADANKSRDYRIYAQFAQVLITKARGLYADEPFGVELKQSAYALDSTTMDLCLTLFPWAQFRRTKAAVKMHTLMDLRGSIPCFIRLTDGKTHDVNILDDIPLEAGAFYIMDRAYVDFQRLWSLHQEGAFFVTRAKTNLSFTVRERRKVDKSSGLRCDQTIKLNGAVSSQKYPGALRRISYFDKENKNRLVFLTNNFVLAALVIARLYKCRWQIELFFKWIKQHLRIKSFFGTSSNAVKTQIWTAVSTYVLVAIVKKELGIQRPLKQILAILSICLFEQVPLCEALTTNDFEDPDSRYYKPLPLFDL
jgi:IS4 transposase